ncbi:hypothetical protein ACFST9_02755 [Hymenobacter monticola]|uniref:T9SS type A sorting domain-containing protein n=1 Tax=Hymenobacter monticola TaxID=1705399 RepID=A0ABY4B291_9BACT|nr:T9SS type A sorting domain-containing protein [Hymenobacter monticola]UOE33120.1 T9SS type A sorting domain-containing protein [Hymenobacter monticola]
MHTITKRINSFLRSCGVGGLFVLLLSPAWAAPAPGASPSLATALAPDGTLRPGTSGSFDAHEYRMLTAPDGHPIFRPAGVRRTTGAGDENWQNGLGSGGVDGGVQAVLAVGNDVYIGGDFSVVGGVPASKIAKWNSATSTWSRVGAGAGITGFGNVNALAMINSVLYVGGGFSTVSTATSSLTVSRLAKWDGTTWSSVGQGVSGDAVSSLAVSGNSLYVGGTFTYVGGGTVAANNVAKWDASTNTWSSLGTSTGNGVSGSVNALAFNGTGTELYVGGEFTSARSGATTVTARNVARYIVASNAWSPLGTTSNGVGGQYGGERVMALAWSTATSSMYVAGYFARGGTLGAANSIVRFIPSNSSWAAVGSGFTHNNGQTAVYSLAVSGTTVYAGGSFTSSGATPLTSVAQFNGTSWAGMGDGMSIGTEGHNSSVQVYVVALVGSSVYAGGPFRRAGTVASNGLARWDGTTWSCPAPGNGADGYLYAVAVDGTSVYVGGYFTHIGGVAANRVAKWNGTTWSSLGTGAANGVGTYPNSVTALAVAGNGDVYVGGNFTLAGGAAANNVAKWNGTTWSSLGTGAANGVNNAVKALALIGSDVYVGGSFSQAGGVATPYLAKWNGTAWGAVGTGVNGPVFALARVGTTLYAGGQFSQAGGATVNFIAQWNGTAWSALGTGFDNSVTALAVSGANLYAGGTFTTGSNLALNHVAKWNGTAWSALGTGNGNGTNGTVYALAAIGNDLYIGGNFSEMNGYYPDGISAKNIARWTGSGWSPLGTGLSYGQLDNGRVHALGVDVDYRVFAGGDFTTVGDNSKATGFVGLFADMPPSLVVTAAQPLDGSYNNLTISNTAAATLTAPLRVRGTLTIQSGGRLLTASQPITGAGSFVLAPGGTLGIADAAGIAATGATGAVQVSGPRTFDAGANYIYSGTTAQVPGPALPATVASLTLSNPAGLTLGQNLTTTQALVVNSGELRTGPAAVILGPTATLSESATGYVTGAVETSRPVATPGQSQDFGGLGLMLTPASSSTALPGATTVRRLTGTAATGSTSVGMKRYFEIHAATNAGLDLTMQAQYRDDELNGVDEANLMFYRATSSAAGPWVAQTGAYARDAANNRISLSGVSGFSVWTLGSSAPLPVELTAFAAIARTGAVQLSWRTASEHNSAHFAVERSTDGHAFAALGQVPAQGNRTTPTNYTHRDANLPAGAALLYYRLRQVDADGSFSYSPVRTVAPAPTTGLALFPNPAHATATLQVTAATSDREVRVLDMRGRQAARLLLPAHAASAVLPLAGLPVGVYAVRVGAATARLVVE